MRRIKLDTMALPTMWNKKLIKD